MCWEDWEGKNGFVSDVVLSPESQTGCLEEGLSQDAPGQLCSLCPSRSLHRLHPAHSSYLHIWIRPETTCLGSPTVSVTKLGLEAGLLAPSASNQRTPVKVFCFPTTPQCRYKAYLSRSFTRVQHFPKDILSMTQGPIGIPWSPHLSQALLPQKNHNLWKIIIYEKYEKSSPWREHPLSLLLPQHFSPRLNQVSPAACRFEMHFCKNAWKPKSAPGFWAENLHGFKVHLQVSSEENSQCNPRH